MSDLEAAAAKVRKNPNDAAARKTYNALKEKTVEARRAERAGFAGSGTTAKPQAVAASANVEPPDTEEGT